MRGGSVRRAVRGSIIRRRLQTIVIGLVLLVSTGASVLALALVVDSNGPFDRAFAAQHGADITATINPARASRAQLEATGKLPGVSAAAGPFAEVTADLEGQVVVSQSGVAVALVPQLTLAGRASPDGPVDDIALLSGHWPTGRGQIVLASRSLPGGVIVGTQVVVTSAPGRPRLTVVGIANSVTDTADGWVTPAEVHHLAAADALPSEQMLYRFSRAGSAQALRSDVASLSKQLPSGAITGTQSYLAVRFQETSSIAPLAPFVVAFGVIGLVMSVLIVANVISGAVVSGYRRIGVLKSVGFTPAQVVAAYAAQALIPAAAGCLAGVLAGNLLAGALLRRTAEVYQVGSLGVPGWVNLVVPLTMLTLVAIAALLPAIRAGRLGAIQAIAAGRAPRGGGGYAAHRLLGRLALPRPVTIGLAAPFARPVRSAATMVAILLGATAVIFAVGLGLSLGRVVTGLQHTDTEQVQVSLPVAPNGPAGGIQIQLGGPHHRNAGSKRGQAALSQNAAGQPTPAQAQRAVEAAVRTQHGTLHYVAQVDQQVSVAGLTRQVAVTAFAGNARWLRYEMISGRWYTGKGQVDVSTYFLSVTGKSIGDDVTFTLGGKQITARIVGEVFDTDNRGLVFITDARTLATAGPTLSAPDQYDIGLRPGTSDAAYVQSLGAALGSDYPVNQNGSSKNMAIIFGLIGLLTLLLSIVAGLGVLNTVVLQTREKVHDLGIFKAIGMTPRQMIIMAVSWVAGTGLIAGIIAVPAGIALQRNLLPVMGHAAGTALPAVVLDVYRAPDLVMLALAGMVIAILGALAPAGWAAAARTESALRAE